MEENTHIERINEDVRRAKQASVSSWAISCVERRLLALRKTLTRHFNLTLVNCEKPQFLLYKEGDFFLPHQDGDSAPGSPEYMKKRQVSVIIFLNGEEAVARQESYCGGSLVFYGLINDPRWTKFGLPLVGQQGLLIAFRSDLVHEVTPVTQGERYTVVSWLSYGTK